MKYLLIAILFIISFDILAQDTIPVKDTTRWTEFRDDYYNPNILLMKEKFDSIYNAFEFKMDSVIARKLFVIDSIKFSMDTITMTGTIRIEDIVYDTIVFMDGTKQFTGYTP